VQSTQSTVRTALRLAGGVMVVVLCLGAAACSSSGKSSTAPLPTVAPPPTDAPLPTTTAGKQIGKPAPLAAVTVINKYEAKNGPKLGTWLLSSVQASTQDPSFVMFRIGPATAADTNVQPGYGFAHEVGGKWAVVSFGSGNVGCPPGAVGNATIPPNVLASFDLTCPS
jgi:hypothetical protein